MRTIGVILLVLSFGYAKGQKDERVTASEELLKFKRGLAKDSYKAAGYQSYAEIESLSVGDRITSAIVRLDELKQFKPSTAADNLIKYDRRAIFLLVDGRTGTPSGTIELEQLKGKWVVKAIGSSPVAVEFSEALKKSEEKDLTLIKVLALNINFAGRQNVEGWQVILLGDRALGQVQPGRSIDFETVVPQLQELANAYNGLPW